jgi:hypothetical protein
VLAALAVTAIAAIFVRRVREIRRDAEAEAEATAEAASAHPAVAPSDC